MHSLTEVSYKLTFVCCWEWDNESGGGGTSTGYRQGILVLPPSSCP